MPHGPYWQWSRAKGGRTLTRRLSAEQAALYKEWIANRRRASGSSLEIEELSEQAGELLLSDIQQRSDNPAGRGASNANEALVP